MAQASVQRYIRIIPSLSQKVPDTKRAMEWLNRGTGQKTSKVEVRFRGTVSSVIFIFCQVCSAVLHPHELFGVRKAVRSACGSESFGSPLGRPRIAKLMASSSSSESSSSGEEEVEEVEKAGEKLEDEVPEAG